MFDSYQKIYPVKAFLQSKQIHQHPHQPYKVGTRIGRKTQSSGNITPLEMIFVI